MATQNPVITSICELKWTPSAFFPIARRSTIPATLQNLQQSGLWFGKEKFKKLKLRSDQVIAPAIKCEFKIEVVFTLIVRRSPWFDPNFSLAASSLGIPKSGPSPNEVAIYYKSQLSLINL